MDKFAFVGKELITLMFDLGLTEALISTFSEMSISFDLIIKGLTIFSNIVTDEPENLQRLLEEENSELITKVSYLLC